MLTWAFRKGWATNCGFWLGRGLKRLELVLMMVVGTAWFELAA